MKIDRGLLGVGLSDQKRREEKKLELLKILSKGIFE